MQTYLITIQDLSAITTQTHFDCTLTANSEEEAIQLAKEQYAKTLDTTPDMIKVTHIINTLDIPF
jgi:hypothetical protein